MAKTPLQLAKSFDFKQDLANRIAKNPDYSKMAEYAVGKDHPANDEYFYAFKDAYEQSQDYANGGDINEDYLKEFLTNRYDDLRYQDEYESGYGEKEYEYYYLPRFEKKYGSREDFTNTGLNAWRKFLEGGN